MTYRPVDWEERFWNKVDKRSDNECWNWIGWKRKDGYGQIRFYEKDKTFKDVRASRLSWELHNGSEIPQHLHVCHHCDNPSCVNPNHLFLGTAKDNQQDKVNKGRYKNSNSAKTHCKRGHTLTGSNLILQKDGRRNCKECARIYWREQYYPKLVKRGYYSELRKRK